MSGLEDSISIIVVDDEQSIRKTVGHSLRSKGYKVRVYAEAKTCLNEFKVRPADIVISDISMPEMDGIELLSKIKKLRPSSEVIVITAHADKDYAVRALKEGAYDFLEKPVSLSELNEAIKKTARYQSVVRERDLLEQQMTELSEREAQRWGIESMIGKTKVMREVLKQIRQLQKSSKTSVLVLGESGTGKELVARAIHYGSQRSALPFIAVNCSAIPANLAESILFGHLKGSFTGAVADKTGSFLDAEGGTLFLDEIGDMPLDMQAKILRVLEDGEVTPVGGAEATKINVRVVSATNRDLEKKVEAGDFRDDLFYRLAGYTIALPALRERKADIPHLAEYFCEKLSSQMGIPKPEITSESMAFLKQQHFQGNIRELRNVIEMALIESSTGQIEPNHLHLYSISDSKKKQTGAVEDLPLNIDEATTILIRRAMAEAKGNVSAAARLLGINRSKLHRELYRINGE
ncbi:hypothetical protein BVX97_03715 [bacterium E08(2017)]|nr:hypothetical protein BVX97_03715 [bacterium E08(2017)]